MDDHYKKSLNYCLNLLAKRSYSEAEMRNKLKSRKLLTQDQIEKLIVKLKEAKFLNDDFFTETYIESQLRRKPQGIKKLTHLLKQKGIEKNLIRQKIEQAKINEKELALKLVEKKKTQLRNLPIQKQKEKIFRFLLSRGFSSETIYKVINFENLE